MPVHTDSTTSGYVAKAAADAADYKRKVAEPIMGAVDQMPADYRACVYAYGYVDVYRAWRRGMPTEPPAFVILEKWNKISPKMRLRSGLKLEQRAAKSYAAEEQKQFARALAIKNCAHEFATIKPEDRSRMTTQACVKCGYVENLPLQTHAA